MSGDGESECATPRLLQTSKVATDDDSFESVSLASSAASSRQLAAASASVAARGHPLESPEVSLLAEDDGVDRSRLTAEEWILPNKGALMEEVLSCRLLASNRVVKSHLPTRVTLT